MTKRIISLILVGACLHLSAVQSGAQSNDPPKVVWAIIACLSVVADVEKCLALILGAVNAPSTLAA